MLPKDIIVKHYEDCLEKHGDTCKGVDWPNEKDAETRYQVMLGVCKGNTRVSILDYGCGLGGLLESMDYFDTDIYIGYDPSEKMIEICKGKYPKNDFTTSLDTVPMCDYVIMNGVFTIKQELSFEQAFDLMCVELKQAWGKCTVGIAFNVMSLNVDWQRDDLFHCSLDMLTEWLCKNISRNFVIRGDYGLYENTIYVYR